MKFMKKLFGSETKSIKLLSARILTDDTHKYYVSFSEHQAGLEKVEYIRLILHCYAKMLGAFDVSDEQDSQAASILAYKMHSLVMDKIHSNTSVFEAAGIDNVATVVSTPPANAPTEIKATLLSENEKERTITVDLSEELHAQQKMFSVLALLQAVLGKVGEKEIDILNLSLLTMDVAFAADDNYSDQTRLDSLPNESFLTACKEKAGEN